MSPQYKELQCPECFGAGFFVVGAKDEDCFYCQGTGYATDDDSSATMYSYEKDW